MLPSGEAPELSAGASRVYTASDCVNPFRTQRLVEASLANSAAARRASALGEDARARRGGGEACAALPRAAWRALPAAGAREAAAAAFREGDAAAAVALLGEALGADDAAQRDASLWANRSAARLAAGDAQGARCVRARVRACVRVCRGRRARRGAEATRQRREHAKCFPEKRSRRGRAHAV